jgi:gliding motility-associated lipoprotein GldD
MNRKMNKRLKNFGILLSLLFFANSCGDNELLIPKPLANIRIDFPERSYSTMEGECPFSFELASYMSVTSPDASNPCHKDISLGQFNGSLHLSYVPVKDNNLNELIAYSIDKVKEHQVRASAIEDTLFINHGKRVFGTFYEFYGNAATPFQFHFTDSVKHFIRGTVYFNTIPNFDSIYPVLQYVKDDFKHLIESASWK